ncbi:MAG: hypothetical protein IPN62_18650 [Flavobacteriales bacterium]|nr:hypothetical protein [Flavobacteriales bacterium]
MEAKATFEVRVDGKRGNNDLKPAEFDIRELRGLLDEVEVLLFPNDRRERPVISYRVEEGSVRNIFQTGVQSIASLGAVIGLVNSQRTLDILEPRTAKAFETIQQWAIEKDYTFTLTTSTDPAVELRVDRSTAYFRSEATVVETELYLYGKVTDAGGKEKPNIHLQVEGQGIFTIEAEESFLAALENNIRSAAWEHEGLVPLVAGPQSPNAPQHDLHFGVLRKGLVRSTATAQRARPALQLAACPTLGRIRPQSARSAQG